MATDSLEIEKQDSRNAEHKRAWDQAPARFKKKAAEEGVIFEAPNYNGHALEYDETLSRVHAPGHTPSFYIPDMADAIDTIVDRLVEKYGTTNEALIKAVAKDLKVPMEEEIERNRGLMLGRVIMFLVKSQNSNMRARVHALIHAIPRLASIAGFPSMRSSARECGVTGEWIRRTRNMVADHLGLPIPKDGLKSAEAREKYRLNSAKNHWRHQRFKPSVHKQLVA